MFYSHPQLVDELLEDMDLPIHRSGGNWLSWPFKVIDLKEVESYITKGRKKGEILAREDFAVGYLSI